VAGSVAGIMEHVGMYPIDTVKTRMQASPQRTGVAETVRTVCREQGAKGLMRGATVIGAGCVPAHIGMFVTYESARARLLDVGRYDRRWRPAMAFACGALGSAAHDSIITPMDVIKQRLQLGSFSGIADCVCTTWRHEGLMGFYRSLPTTLVMNLPFMGTLVTVNESLKQYLHLDVGGATTLSTAPWYFLTAGISGVCAAAVTLPLDVVKTRLQTQGLAGEAVSWGHCGCGAATVSAQPTVRYVGIVAAARAIWLENGLRGFANGLVPRIALAMPAAAMCWGTYETILMVLHNARGYIPSVGGEPFTAPNEGGQGSASSMLHHGVGLSKLGPHAGSCGGCSSSKHYGHAGAHHCGHEAAAGGGGEDSFGGIELSHGTGHSCAHNGT